MLVAGYPRDMEVSESTRSGEEDSGPSVARPVVTILAPFAASPAHLGHRRATRFSRWLHAAGYEVVIIGAGSSSIETSSDVSVRDPIGVWPRLRPEPALAPPRPQRRGLGVARRVLIPDPSVVWALRAASSWAAHKAAKTSSILISTGPPESPHLAASLLSRTHGVPHLMDYRDGWLDEPLKEEIRSRGPRRSAEAALEAWALRNASVVTVTSDVWGQELSARHPWVNGRLRTITNVIPADYRPDATRGEIGLMPRLVYAGRLSGSRHCQSAGVLLNLLRLEARLSPSSFEVLFVGALCADEIAEIGRFRAEVSSFGWVVRHKPHCDYQSALTEVAQADGLLLTSASNGAIPSKLYDYLATGRPILCLATRGSAAWNVCSGLDQVWAIDPSEPEGRFGFCTFATRPGRFKEPEEFGEVHVSGKFVELVNHTVRFALSKKYSEDPHSRGDRCDRA